MENFAAEVIFNSNSWTTIMLIFFLIILHFIDNTVLNGHWCVFGVHISALMVLSNTIAALRWPFSVSVMVTDSWDEIIIYNGGAVGAAWYDGSPPPPSWRERSPSRRVWCCAGPSRRVRPHLKQPGVAALKPPFRSGPKPKTAPAPASRSAEPTSSQTKFVVSPPSPSSPSSSGSRCQAGNNSRLLDLWMGPLVIF